MANPIVFGMVKSLHDIATAIWIGGLVHMSMTILPSFRSVKDETVRKQVLMLIQSRLSIMVYLSIAILVVTGILESWHSQAFRGFFSFENTYSFLLSLKHMLVVVMVLIAGYRQMMLRQMKRMGVTDKEKARKKEKLSIMLVLANTVIGIAVIFLSGFLAAFSTV